MQPVTKESNNFQISFWVSRYTTVVQNMLNIENKCVLVYSVYGNSEEHNLF